MIECRGRRSQYDSVASDTFSLFDDRQKKKERIRERDFDTMISSP